MMGRKDRALAPIPAMALEDLIPADHFYRHVDRVLDLSFVRELVHGRYADGIGRPSIDPVVFFKLQLVLFFEGLRSERQLLRLAADRLSVRWYLGYNLNEALPDHSSLTRIRLRYGLAVFRRFFEAIVESNANRQDWCGVVSSTLMPPRCGPLRRSIPSLRCALPSKPANRRRLDRPTKRRKWSGPRGRR